MPLILKLASLHLPRLHRFGRGDAFERLNPRHLIGTQNVPAHRRQQRCIGIDRADRFDLLGEGLGLLGFGLGVKPIAAAMGL